MAVTSVAGTVNFVAAKGRQFWRECKHIQTHTRAASTHEHDCRTDRSIFLLSNFIQRMNGQKTNMRKTCELRFSFVRIRIARRRHFRIFIRNKIAFSAFWGGVRKGEREGEEHFLFTSTTDWLGWLRLTAVNFNIMPKRTKCDRQKLMWSTNRSMPNVDFALINSLSIHVAKTVETEAKQNALSIPSNRRKLNWVRIALKIVMRFLVHPLISRWNRFEIDSTNGNRKTNLNNINCLSVIWVPTANER